MSRNYPDWLTAFMNYSQFSEAPRHMHFWTGVSVLAGALRRRVWINQAYFKWLPNFYIILVAPPGIVSKSTTIGIGMNLLKRVPGIHFGPDIVTWQALLGAFGDSTEAFEYQSVLHPMSALTLVSSEFGNLLDPTDKGMVDLLVTLWDGLDHLEKRTKNSGNDSIQSPWINLIACTTPAWIAGNFPEYMIGGGFTSRCLFVYAEKKAQYVAYPGLAVPHDMTEVGDKLVADLEHIAANVVGEYRLTDDAVAWGEQWYRKHYESPRPVGLDDERFGGYMARKQTHIHKLAMILAASSSDIMLITPEHLSVASTMITDLEPDMAMVFGRIGKTEASVYADRLVQYVRTRGPTPYADVYRFVHSYFPGFRDFEDTLTGLVRAGFLRLTQSGSSVIVTATDKI